MEDNNIIFCLYCYKANEQDRTTCINCGAPLKKGNINHQNNKIKTSERTNKVALKFSVIVSIIKFVGYVASIISFITLLSLGETGFAFICLICGTFLTLFSTLIFEAIAEGLQLLEDIKNK